MFPFIKGGRILVLLFLDRILRKYFFKYLKIKAAQIFYKVIA
jgi:hypothetical protein